MLLQVSYIFCNLIVAFCDTSIKILYQLTFVFWLQRYEYLCILHASPLSNMWLENTLSGDILPKNAATALIKNATVIIIHCKIVKCHLTVCSDFFLKYSFQVIVLPVLLFGNLIVLDVLIDTTHHWYGRFAILLYIALFVLSIFMFLQLINYLYFILSLLLMSLQTYFSRCILN